MGKVNNQVVIVFIHGAGLGSFIWSELETFIDHPTLSVNFPNREKGDKANYNLYFDDYLKQIIKQIEGSLNNDKIVLVAHSIGGCLGLNLLDYFDEKIIGFVGIGAAIPQKEESFSSCFPFPQKYLLPLILNIFGTKPPNKSIRNELCNDLTEEQCSEITDKFTPESKWLYTTKIDYERLPRATMYVKLTRDKAFSTVIQEKMAQNLRTKNIVEFECGHLPMLNKPKDLAKVLNDFISKILS